MKPALWVLLSVLFASLRIGGIKSPAFQAFAHIFMGVLGAVCCRTRDRIVTALFVILCVIEIACFARDHFR